MQSVGRLFKACFWLGLWGLAQANAACLGDPKAGRVYIFDVVPQFTAARIYSSWSPLLQRVGNASAMCFELRVAPSIPEFEHKLLNGEPAFAFVNPYHAVLAHKKQRYQPLLSDGDEKLKGILVVRQDSPFRQLPDLQGKILAYPAPNAFAATLLMRAELAKKKIDTQAQFVKTHSNVYRTVIQNEAAAGGGVNNTLDSEVPEVRQQLRVMYETAAYYPHPVVTHPSINPMVREKFFKAFESLTKDEAGQKMLDAVGITKPIQVNYAKHYKELEELGLEKFLVLN
ncbi:MAG: phosphate/phosphite/phosphonate ABC transporter substrate-binding protein [Betaproteobacteria bacterium]|nr:phosphate/phosphite/phosphonate ABC transporter substrate-binding protein [Betaproteobacteria bacterium]